tara:strand:- start:700 stop:1008 length:309 start_codon:yes stop_codon:yes gene_type:complete
MATTYNWQIMDLERETDDGYIFKAHYSVDAIDGSKTGNYYGVVFLDKPETLVPYADVTLSSCIDWVKAKLGTTEVTRIETILQAELDRTKSLNTSNGMPWLS